MKYTFVDGPLNVNPTENQEFYDKCSEYRDRKQSQNFQDVWALYENDFIEKGFFVEFGATDGYTGCNSYLLSKSFNWSGILAEPNPFWHDKLNENRKSPNTKIITDCVYTETGKTLDFLAVEAADLSTIVGFGADDEHAETRKKNNVISVNTISLIDLLKNNKAPKSINYLSVDTEGSEFDILKAFFDDPKSSDYDIKCITVEHNFMPEFREKLYNLLTSKGYTRKYEDVSRWDDFYLKVN